MQVSCKVTFVMLKNKFNSYRLLKRFLFGAIIGIFLGLYLQSYNDPSHCARQCSQAKFSAANESQMNAEYEPRLINVAKLNKRTIRKVQIQPNVYRPRYYSTELGIRKKLFVGVISKKENVKYVAAVLNKTLKESADNIAIFTNRVPSDYQYGTIVHAVESHFGEVHILPVLNIISTKYLADYDLFFLARNSVYIRGMALLEFVSEISVSIDVFIGTKYSSRPCSLSSGILFSNSVIESIVSSLDSYNAVSADNAAIFDIVQKNMNMSCSNLINVGKQIEYSVYEIENLDQELDHLSSAANFRNAIAIYPVRSLEDFFKVHLKVCEIELENAQLELKTIENEIILTQEKQPDKSHQLLWPIGSNPQYESKTRFDVLTWQYFNESHLLFPNEKTVIAKLHGADQVDVEDIMNQAKEWIQKTHSTKDYIFDKLVNGYRRCDLTRGMEYLVDLKLCNVLKTECVVRRLELFKGLSKMQLLNVPFVTENVIVTLIIPITTPQLKQTNDFINHLAKVLSRNAARYRILLVLLSDQSEPAGFFNHLKSKIDKFTEILQKRGIRTGHVNFKLPSINFISQIAIIDLVSSRLTDNSLVMFIHPEMIVHDDFLNRVRMNTIQGYQVFFPIPFVQYHPGIIYQKETDKKFVIQKEYGQYDRQSFDYASFYFSDYVKARKLVPELPIVHFPMAFSQHYKYFLASNIELIHMFIRYRSVHIFRALDKNFLVQYSEIKCKETADDKIVESCLTRKYSSFANQKTLAALYLEYERNASKISVNAA